MAGARASAAMILTWDYTYGSLSIDLVKPR